MFFSASCLRLISTRCTAAAHSDVHGLNSGWIAKLILFLNCLVVSTLIGQSALANTACVTHPESLACQRQKLVEGARFCAGCTPPASFMKIELAWDGGTDLDLHVWYPPTLPIESRHVRVSYNNRGGGRKAKYSCDDQGDTGSCVKSGERVNIAPGAFVYSENEDRVYCAAVHVYRGGRPNFKLTLASEGAAGVVCDSLPVTETGKFTAAESAAFAASEIGPDICGGMFPPVSEGQSRWLALIVFQAPRHGQSVALDEAIVARGLSCRHTGTGKTRKAASHAPQ